MSTELTQERLKELLTYDPETGVFTWNRSRSGVRRGMRAGYVNQLGYVLIRVVNCQYLAHRLAYLYMTGAWPQHQVDHVDGVCGNNSWANLRACTHQENHQNEKVRVNSTVATGVGWYKPSQKWRAYLTVQGRYIGKLFDTKEEAIEARKSLKAKYHTFQPLQRGETPCRI